ncbi:unnamed protein product [Rotaria socialis]|uniref:Integrase catalytic domain-containing protein n=1 Tax=Rotaria socialis TaxID=392032 RepID=A0A817UCE5_9BILA|nr:unnamed protein product [Rotaria socialis]
MQSSILNNTCIRNTVINTEINAVTTRAQAKLQTEPLSSTVNTSSTSTTSQSTCSSAPTVNQLYDFSLAPGIVYRLVGRDDTTIKLFYVPSKLIPDLMAAYHDHPLSGHFGIGHTWSTLRNTYYWSRMKDTIISYIKSCSKCSQFNVDQHKPPGFLQSIQPSNDVFQILVVTDRLSSYVFAKASPTNTAQDTARILMEEIILVHGSPDIIITGQGTHFKNELLHAISNLVGCQRIFSTPYHPQTNGQTERWNSTFVIQITKYCNTDQNNRNIFLPSIVYTYNHGIHSSTGFSPYQLVFGRQPRHPFTPPASTFVFSKPYDHWTQVIKYRNTALHEVQANILHQQQLSKTRFDKNRSHPSFVLGDLVWMKILVERQKLKARYIGPVRIIRILSPVSFIAEDDNLQQFQVHSNNIRCVYFR